MGNSATGLPAQLLVGGHLHVPSALSRASIQRREEKDAPARSTIPIGPQIQDPYAIPGDESKLPTYYTGWGRKNRAVDWKGWPDSAISIP